MKKPRHPLPTARVIPQKYANHLIMLARYGSARKVWNLGKALFFYVRGQRTINSLPPFLKVEVTNRCEVSCRYCYQKKSDNDYPLSKYKELLDRLSPCLFEVSLHDIGEPLLQENICEYVRYAHSKSVGTYISSSLSVSRSDEFWRELVTSGLDRLVAAVDGLEPATYNAYRTRGDLPLVMDNLQRILRYRTEAKSDLRVTWQMIDFPWNRHEHTEARRRAADLGCDDFMLIHEETLPRRQYYKAPQKRNRNCLMPYLMFIVSADGKVRPCCNIYNGISRDLVTIENVVGDLRSQNFDNIWNSRSVQQIRDKKQIGKRDYCSMCQEM